MESVNQSTLIIDFNLSDYR